MMKMKGKIITMKNSRMIVVMKKRYMKKMNTATVKAVKKLQKRKKLAGKKRL